MLLINSTFKYDVTESSDFVTTKIVLREFFYKRGHLKNYRVGVLKLEMCKAFQRGATNWVVAETINFSAYAKRHLSFSLHLKFWPKLENVMKSSRFCFWFVLSRGREFCLHEEVGHNFCLHEKEREFCFHKQEGARSFSRKKGAHLKKFKNLGFKRQTNL